MEDERAHDPREPRRYGPPLLHQMHWGWGNNSRRDIRLVAGVMLVLLLVASAVNVWLSRPSLDADGRAYVRGIVPDAELNDAQLDDVARAVCHDDALSLDERADRATATIGATVSRDLAYAVRETACPTG